MRAPYTGVHCDDGYYRVQILHDGRWQHFGPWFTRPDDAAVAVGALPQVQDFRIVEVSERWTVIE